MKEEIIERMKKQVDAALEMKRLDLAALFHDAMRRMLKPARLSSPRAGVGE